MSVAHYEDHLVKLSDGFARAGVDVGTNEHELEFLSELETAIRSGVTQARLHDSEAGFSGVFIEHLRAEAFEEYIEYRKVYLSMTLDEFIDSRNIDAAEEAPEEQSESSEYYENGEEAYLENPELDSLETGNPAPAGTSGNDLIQRMAYIAATTQTVAEVEAAETHEEIDNLLNLYTEPYGVDSNGFDMWHEKEIETFGVDGQGFDLWQPNIPSFEGITEAVAKAEDEAEPEAEWILFTHPEDVDEQGFDQWVSFDADEESLDGSEEDAEASVPELDWTLLSEHFGEDEDGFDRWVSTNQPAFDLEPVEDGFDHSGDESRKGLGELLTKFYGFDDQGFDRWSDSSEEAENPADMLAGVKTESAGLGELLTEPRGVDSDGFDTWVVPEVQESAHSAVSSDNGGVPSPNASLSNVTATHAPQLNTTSVSHPRVLEEEDKMFLMLSKAFSTSRKALRRFWS